MPVEIIESCSLIYFLIKDSTLHNSIAASTVRIDVLTWSYDSSSIIIRRFFLLSQEVMLLPNTVDNKVS